MEKKKKRYLIGIVLFAFGMSVFIAGTWHLYERNPEAFFSAIAVTTIVLVAISALVKGLEMLFEED